MKISLNIILDVLQPYHQEIYMPPNNGYTYSKCLPLPDDVGETSSTCIYVGGLAKVLALRGNKSDICCICLRDRVKDNLETAENLSGLIIINENITQVTLLLQVQNRFFAILDWIQCMHETMIHNGSMQDIVDLCAPIIDNYIAVSDSSLMLLAYSRNIPCDDPICKALVEYGYHPEETIQQFREYDLFKKWEMADGIFIDDTMQTAKYVALNKIFKFRNVYFAHVVLTCNRTPLTLGTIDLFQLFLDVLAVYIEHAWEAKSTCNHIYDTFLTDLIESNISSKKVIEERAQYVGIPLSGRFCLFQIIATDSANMSIGKMLMEFSDLFPRFKFIRYQQRIVAIHNFQGKDDYTDELEQVCRKLDTFLVKYDALCGISLFFYSLDEAPFSFRQTTLALKYIDRLSVKEIDGNLPSSDNAVIRINHFSDSYVFCLLGESEENAELWYHSDYHWMMQKLNDYDVRHKSDTLQLLRMFLGFERSATQTGQALNMHRNNVLYHINRIEDMLGIDFSNPSTRFTMLMSFVLLELYGFNKE